MTEDKNFDDGIIRPLQVPAEHQPEAPIEARTVFALAYLGKGTASHVTAKLKQLGDSDATEQRVGKILNKLFDKGLINGSDDSGDRVYDLAKVTRPHHGHVEPDSPNRASD